MKTDLDDVIAQLRIEFMARAMEQLSALDEAIENITNDEGNQGEYFSGIQRTFHSLKGMAGSYGFSFVSVIAHRLEELIESSLRLSNEEWFNIQEFVDEIRTIIESGDDPSEVVQEDILDRLPISRTPHISYPVVIADLVKLDSARSHD